MVVSEVLKNEGKMEKGKKYILRYIKEDGEEFYCDVKKRDMGLDEDRGLYYRRRGI